VTGASFVDEVEALVERVLAAWPEARQSAERDPWLAGELDSVVREGAASLLRKA